MSVLIKLRDARNLPSAEDQVRKYILENSKGGVEKPPFINKLHLLFGVPIL